jgi:aconitate hydratase
LLLTKPLTIEAVRDGSKMQLLQNHTYNQGQIEWYNEGSALNLIKKQNV